MVFHGVQKAKALKDARVIHSSFFEFLKDVLRSLEHALARVRTKIYFLRRADIRHLRSEVSLIKALSIERVKASLDLLREAKLARVDAYVGDIDEVAQRPAPVVPPPFFELVGEWRHPDRAKKMAETADNDLVVVTIAMRKLL